MVDPTVAMTTALTNATKVANTPFFTTIIDKVTGFKISQWAAEAEVRKKLIHDEYEKAKDSGIRGIQYISTLREATNLIDTAVKTAKYLKSNKTNEIKMNNDFFWNTIEHSKTVSDEFVQDLIAKIIASEYETPESYSMGTLQTIKMLGKKELILFERVCGLLINKSILPHDLFTGQKNTKELMKKLQLDFGSLQALQSLGLFLPNPMDQTIDIQSGENITIKYLSKELIFEPQNSSNEFKIPRSYGLSNVGKQILKHLNPPYSPEFYLWLKDNYKISNYKRK